MTWQHLIQTDTFMTPIPVCVLVLHVSGCCRADIFVSAGLYWKKTYFYNAACW
jgi:hypothetical protein